METWKLRSARPEHGHLVVEIDSFPSMLSYVFGKGHNRATRAFVKGEKGWIEVPQLSRASELESKMLDALLAEAQNG